MEDIKSKIRKLLSLATSSNEAEAMLALIKAQALMNEHRISELDLELSDNNPVDFQEMPDTSRFGHKWKQSLAIKIAMINHCKPISFQKCIKLAGRQENILVANAMYSYIISFIRSKKLNGAALKNYGLGFYWGLCDKLDEGQASWIDDNPNATDLVAMYDQENVEHLKELGIGYSTQEIKSKPSWDGIEHYEAGFNDGRKLSLHRQMTSNAKRIE